METHHACGVTIRIAYKGIIIRMHETQVVPDLVHQVRQTVASTRVEGAIPTIQRRKGRPVGSAIGMVKTSSPKLDA